MSKRKKQDLPRAEVLERNLRDEHVVEAPYTYRVCSWRPQEAGSDAPCTQVHILIPATPEITFAIRLKSARALDELVGVLLEYRNEVWPEDKGS